MFLVLFLVNLVIMVNDDYFWWILPVVTAIIVNGIEGFYRGTQPLLHLLRSLPGV